MIDWEIVTIVLGSVAATLSVGMGAYFARSEEGIARAVALDKFAEGINMLVIVTFAVFYKLGLFVKMPLWGAVALRMTAIIAVMVSTVHLFIQTRKLAKERKRHESR